MSEEIKNGIMKNIKAYPEIAIRELITNMLIHQDFNISGTGPIVEIFNGRIEFSNPGKPLIDTARFIDHNPVSRNEGLAVIMRKMKMCEERGSGIDKVISESEKYQLPAPEFIVEEKFFKAILYAPRALKEMTREDKIRACYQHCCLKYVNRERMTNQTLRERFKLKKELFDCFKNHF